VTSLWSSQELDRIGRALELQIAPRRVDGTLRRSVPIWVVTVGADVYVRTWYRRPHGWFGQVLESGRARIRVPGLEVDVAVEEQGEGTARLRAGIDASYRAKYERHGGADDMVTAASAATTLRLLLEQYRRKERNDE
jgi:hypothetical protein